MDATVQREGCYMPRNAGTETCSSTSRTAFQIVTGGSLIRMRMLPLEGSPMIMRSAVLGAAVAGLVGSVVGLVIGLFAYPPTAWFAVIELGLPAALLGGLCGLAIGAIASIGMRGTSDVAT
jgi:hypothetical protein